MFNFCSNIQEPKYNQIFVIFENEIFMREKDTKILDTRY